MFGFASHDIALYEAKECGAREKMRPGCRISVGEKHPELAAPHPRLMLTKCGTTFGACLLFFSVSPLVKRHLIFAEWRDQAFEGSNLRFVPG